MKYFRTLILAACFAGTSGAAERLDHAATKPANAGVSPDTALKWPALKECVGSEGERVKAEIQKLTLAYESRLEAPRDRITVEAAKSRAAERENAKLKLLGFIGDYGASCFTGTSRLDELCPQLSVAYPIKTKDGLEMRYPGGYVLRRGRTAKGEWQSTWTLRKADQTLALLMTRPGSPSVSQLSLAGKWGKSVQTSSRQVMGRDTTIQETSAQISSPIEVKLAENPSYQQMASANMTQLQACVAYGDPGRVLAQVAAGEQWSPEDSRLSFGRHLGYTMDGGWEGAQKGARGLAKGLESATVGTWEGLKGLVSIAGAVGKGSFSYASNPATRAKVHEGIAKALGKAGDVYMKAWKECEQEQGSNLYAIAFCMDRKALSATGEGVGKLLSALGKQVETCWTGEGKDYPDEYFSECMGQVVFVTATSAAGGGLYQAGGKLAATGSNVGVRMAGRGAALLSEWVIDQTGFATMGPTAIKKLDAAMKATRKEIGELVEKGALDLSDAESQELRKYLQDHVRGGSAVLPQSLKTKVDAADPQALSRWVSSVENAVSQGSVERATQGLKIDAKKRSALESYARAYQDAYGSGVQADAAVEHMSNLAKNWEPAEIEGLAGLMKGVKKSIDDDKGFRSYVASRSRLVEDQIRSLEASRGSHGAQEEFYQNRLKQLREESKDLRNSHLDPTAARRSAARDELRRVGQDEEDIAQMLECFR
jgi:hypothetical protein